jgi:RNA polymerase sigma-70 factor, ECF subfamily
MCAETLDPVEEAVRMILAHRTVLLASIRMFVRDSSLVEDILSEATLVMIKSWERYDQTRPFVPWAVGIARNIASLKRRTESRLLITDDAIDRFANEVASSGDEPHREACYLALERCVDRLPPRHRTLVRFRYYRKHGFRRLAERCGKTVGALHAIFQRLHRSLSECVLRELADQ